MFRDHLNLQPGQVWQSSDRRRFRAVKITDVPMSDDLMVVVGVLYPRVPGHERVQLMDRSQFYTVGQKGYDRLS